MRVVFSHEKQNDIQLHLGIVFKFINHEQVSSQKIETRSQGESCL